MRVEAPLERLFARLPWLVWRELAVELDQLVLLQADGRLSLHLDLVGGRVRGFAFERSRTSAAPVGGADAAER